MRFLSLAAMAAFALCSEVSAQKTTFRGIAGAISWEGDARRYLDEINNECPALDVTGASQRCGNLPDNVLSKIGNLEPASLQRDLDDYPHKYNDGLITQQCAGAIAEFQKYATSIHTTLPLFKTFACEPTKIGNRKQQFANAISKRLNVAGQFPGVYKTRVEKLPKCNALNAKVDAALASIQADTDEISPYLQVGGELLCLGL